jgi:hypothetical protein
MTGEIRTIAILHRTIFLESFLIYTTFSFSGISVTVFVPEKYRVASCVYMLYKRLYLKAD